MNKTATIHSFGDLLAALRTLSDEHDAISIDHVLDVLGTRSFGPLLLLIGAIMSAPVIGDIPGVPSVLGLLIILIAVQIMVHRQHIWVPQFLLRRSVQKEQLTRTLSWLERPAGWVDRILKQRLTVFISTPGRLVIAILCVTLALLTPAMEFVVFSANVAGLALVLFGLALVAHDGLMALIGFVLCASVGALLVWGLVL